MRVTKSFGVIGCALVVWTADEGCRRAPRKPRDGLVEVAAGGTHTCARTSDGHVRCWGAIASRPGELVAGLAGVAQLACGQTFCCARVSDGTVRCWGMNGRGQLGDGTTTERRTPVQVAGLHDAAEIAAGVFFVCARLRDGTARCWGTNESGQLGDGTTQARSAPTPVRGLADVAQLALGESHGCARLNDGTVRCWGANDACQLGHPETTPNSAEPAAQPTPSPPVRVDDLDHVVELAAGDRHTCARSENGRMRCWGDDHFGQLGTPRRGALACAARTVEPLRDLALAQLALGGNRSCARLADGSVRCWGDNGAAQSGRVGGRACGTERFHTVCEDEPTVGPVRDVAQLSAGGEHTCALLRDGSARCWGRSEDARLGAVASANPCEHPVTVDWP